MVIVTIFIALAGIDALLFIVTRRRNRRERVEWIQWNHDLPTQETPSAEDEFERARRRAAIRRTEADDK
jgi:uncharacterized membrane protein YdfJ with MMPL/SSD domain